MRKIWINCVNHKYVAIKTMWSFVCFVLLSARCPHVCQFTSKNISSSHPSDLSCTVWLISLARVVVYSVFLWAYRYWVSLNVFTISHFDWVVHSKCADIANARAYVVCKETESPQAIQMFPTLRSSQLMKRKNKIILHILLCFKINLPQFVSTFELKKSLEINLLIFESTKKEKKRREFPLSPNNTQLRSIQIIQQMMSTYIRRKITKKIIVGSHFVTSI